MADYKNLRRVFGADKKFRPEDHCLVSRGLKLHPAWLVMPNSDPRDGIFYPHRTLVFDSFSCIPFDFECFILKGALINIHNDVYVGHFFKLTSL